MRNFFTLLFAATTLLNRAVASEHPGNIFFLSEEARIALPTAWSDWTAVDVEGKEVAHGKGSPADLGKLPVGYFEVKQTDGPGKVSAAVVVKSEPVEDTPIAMDAAMSWFYSDPQQIHDVCKLCRIAGVRWVRDRASWPEVEPARGRWAKDTRYEKAMRIQHEEGLKILQINHASPPWASKNGSHFPDDLRDVYNFYREIAKRWKGQFDAFEPWNEPDIIEFGGHTGCEIATFNKAAYWGLHRGDPQLTINDAVFAIDRAETLDEFGWNEAYPYFDRYDLHHYSKLERYPQLYARHRAVSGGRPMWTTEFNLTVHWADEKTHEPAEDELRVQGFRVGKVFAEAMYEGPEKLFYFILGDYVERNLQYGLIHADLTPRPAYVSFAAVGRLLNGAKPVGKVDLGDEKLKGYLFETIIDGQQKETLVTWSETKPTKVEVPGVEKTFDYLGRDLPGGGKQKLTRETMFMVLPRGGAKDLKITPPPAKAKWLDGKPCPVVLQLLGQTDYKQSAYRIDKSKELKLVAYNFGKKAARGKLSLQGASGDAGELEIAPGAREERTIKVNGAGKVTAVLELGDLGHAVVSARTALAAPAAGK